MFMDMYDAYTLNVKVSCRSVCALDFSQELFGGEDVDGFLVGGASLTKDFHEIIKAARK